MTASCKLCHQDIVFSDDPEYISPSGKKYPLDTDSAGVIIGRHSCSVWEAQNRKYYDCRKCGRKIYFDNKAAKSKYGKAIPQDANTGFAHECPNSN
jgi:hypothetical protein